MKHALVTGASGFLGSNLVRKLNKRNVEVTVFRRSSSSLDNLDGCEYHDFVGSLDAPGDLEKAADSCDAIFHLAAIGTYTFRDRRIRELVNVDAVRSLVTTLGKKTGIRLVHCSSVAAVGVSDKPDMILDEKVAFNAASIHYNDTKWRGEKIVLEAAQRGMDAVVVNPGMIIGAHGLKEVQRSVVRKIAQGAMRMYPPGGNCFSFVEDVADGMILAFDLGRKGERYILGGHNLTYGDYFGRIAGLFGVKPPGIRLSPLALPFLGGLADLLFGKLGWDAGKLAALFGFYSSAKAERELGYRISPMDTIIESLRPLGDPHAECA